jgi:hypothetical protein
VAVTTYDGLARNILTAARRLKLKIRGDFFNTFDHAEFQNHDSNITSVTFGQVLNTYDPRIIQLAARLSFWRSGCSLG